MPQPLDPPRSRLAFRPMLRCKSGRKAVANGFIREKGRPFPGITVNRRWRNRERGGAALRAFAREPRYRLGKVASNRDGRAMILNTRRRALGLLVGMAAALRFPHLPRAAAAAKDCFDSKAFGPWKAQATDTQAGA